MLMVPRALSCSFFFFNDTATTEIYTLSLHDALPISPGAWPARLWRDQRGTDLRGFRRQLERGRGGFQLDRKSTRLNSSHQIISYAVFCLKKKKKRLSINNNVMPAPPISFVPASACSS